MHRWSEALHGVAGSPGVHFGGQVLTKQNDSLIAENSLIYICTYIDT